MGATLALSGRRRNGDEFPVDISLNYERTGDGSFRAIAFVRDITERRRAGSRAPRERANLPAARRGHRRPRADDARSVRPRDHVEPRRRADQGMGGRGDHRDAISPCSTSPTTLRRASPHATWNRLRPTGSRTTKAGACGAMVAASGPRPPRGSVRDDHGTLRGYAKITRDRTESHRARRALEALADSTAPRFEQRPEEELVMVVVSRLRDGRRLTRRRVDHRRRRPAPSGPGPGRRRHARHRFGGRRRLAVTSVARYGRCEVVPDVSTNSKRACRAGRCRSQIGRVRPARRHRRDVRRDRSAASKLHERFQPHETDLLQTFAMQASAAFALARARREVEQLHIISDRERIARDLHDTVIQRLFAVGLALEATARRPTAEAQERIRRAVGDIDDTIRAIRSVIFSLEATEETRQGLRARVLEVVSDAVPTLGFEPSVTFSGPVDTLTDDHLTNEITGGAALRRSRTWPVTPGRRVSTSLDADNDDMHLVVEDDGVGAAEFHREGGHGVSNLAERASNLGGRASVSTAEPHGTVVDWRVPINPGPA